MRGVAMVSQSPLVQAIEASVSTIASGFTMGATRTGVVRATIAGTFDNLHRIKELLLRL